MYGMAGPVLEAAQEAGVADLVTVIPGVTAATAAAALLGAPLMHDFAVISLSDLVTPWQVIAARLEAAAAGGRGQLEESTGGWIAVVVLFPAFAEDGSGVARHH